MALDQSKIQRKLDELKRQDAVRGATMWKAPIGKSVVRILPYKEGTFWFEAALHFGIGGRGFFCPRRMIDEDCWLCNKVTELFASGEKVNIDLSKRIRARSRIYYNIVDMQEPDKGVQVFASGIRIFEDLLGHAADPDWGDFTDPDNGYNVIIERKGTGIETTYIVRLQRNPSVIQNKGWLKDLKELDQLATFDPPEVMKAAYEVTEREYPVETITPVDFEEQLAAGLKMEQEEEKEEKEEKEEEKVPNSPGKEEAPICYGKHFGKLEECEGCKFARECSIAAKERLAKRRKNGQQP